MKRHATLPDEENLERVRQVVSRLVEQHIPEPATQHHPHRAPEQQIFMVLNL